MDIYNFYLFVVDYWLTGGVGAKHILHNLNEEHKNQSMTCIHQKADIG